MLKEGLSMKRIFYRLFFVLIIPVIAVLCFVLVAPAFADMKKVDEKELSRANASVTGVPIKDTVADVDRDAVRQETLQTIGTVDKRDAGFSPSVSKETNSVNLSINGQTTFQFYLGPTTTNVTGGITSVKPLR